MNHIEKKVINHLNFLDGYFVNIYFYEDIFELIFSNNQIHFDYLVRFLFAIIIIILCNN